MLIVGKRERALIGTEANVQLRLGYIDSGKPFYLRHHRTSSRCLPSLATGIFFPYNRSGLSVVGARRPSLLDGVSSPMMHRPAAPPLMTLLHLQHTRMLKKDRFSLEHQVG